MSTDEANKFIDDFLSVGNSELDNLVLLDGVSLANSWRKLTVELRVVADLLSVSRGDMKRIGNARATTSGESLLCVEADVHLGRVYARGRVDSSWLLFRLVSYAQLYTDNFLHVSVFLETAPGALSTSCTASVVIGSPRYIVLDQFETPMTFLGGVGRFVVLHLTQITTVMEVLKETYFVPIILKAVQEPLTNMTNKMLCS